MAKFTTTREKPIIGLDIEAGSVAASQLDGNGSRDVSQIAIAPLEGGLIKEGEVIDPEGLSAVLRSMFAEHKLPKTVRVGVANQRVAVRSFQLPLLDDPKELDAAIRFQAQEHLPMPLDQAVLDHQVVARFDNDDGVRRMEVVAVAARRDMLQSLLAAVSGAGLQPVGVDLSAFALIRALSGEAVDAATHTELVSQANGSDVANGANGSDVANGARGSHATATLYCNLGDVTNLAVARGSTCLFTRISLFGVESIAQRLAERRNLTLDHARGWLAHVGLDRPVVEIEGDEEIIAVAREVLEEGAVKLADELRLSLEFYAAQEDVPPVESIVLAGPGIAISGLAGRIQGGIGQGLKVARPHALGQLDDNAAARLTISYGLALEE